MHPILNYVEFRTNHEPYVVHGVVHGGLPNERMKDKESAGRGDKAAKKIRRGGDGESFNFKLQISDFRLKRSQIKNEP